MSPTQVVWVSAACGFFVDRPLSGVQGCRDSISVHEISMRPALRDHGDGLGAGPPARVSETGHLYNEAVDPPTSRGKLSGGRPGHTPESTREIRRGIYPIISETTGVPGTRVPSIGPNASFRFTALLTLEVAELLH